MASCDVRAEAWTPRSRKVSLIPSLRDGVVEADRFGELLKDLAVLLAAGHGSRTQCEDDQTLTVRVWQMGVDLNKGSPRETAVGRGREYGLAEGGRAAGKFEVLDADVALG